MPLLLVSIVTPAYNQASFLPETIESVLSQDYPHIEYRVLNDGSTDETEAILREYEGRLEWESHPNMGQTPTINKGWDLSTGDVLIWLNSDDTLLPGAVTAAVEYLEAHPETGIVYADTLFTEPDGSPMERNVAQPRFDYERFVVECHNPIPQPSAFIRRSVVEQTGPLDPYYYYFMDWDFWLRAGLHCRIDYLPELWSTYRLHPESKTVAQAARSAPELERMLPRLLRPAGRPEPIRRREREAFANMYFNTGGYDMKGAAPGAAARAARKAVGTYPLGLARPAMVRKFLYCTLGTSALYRGRAWARRLASP